MSFQTLNVRSLRGRKFLPATPNLAAEPVRLVGVLAQKNGGGVKIISVNFCVERRLGVMGEFGYALPPKRPCFSDVHPAR
jgi:hypothetical protein